MSSFSKTFLVILGIISAIFLFIAGIFWGLYQLFGQDGFVIAFVIIVIIMLSFAITAVIEEGT